MYARAVRPRRRAARGRARERLCDLQPCASATRTTFHGTSSLRIFNRSGQVAQEQRLRLAPGVTRSVEINIGNPDIFPVDRLGRRTLRARSSASTRSPIRQAYISRPWRSTTWIREAPASCLVVRTRCRPPHSEGHNRGGHASALPTATRATHQVKRASGRCDGAAPWPPLRTWSARAASRRCSSCGRRWY